MSERKKIILKIKNGHINVSSINKLPEYVCGAKIFSTSANLNSVTNLHFIGSRLAI